MGFQAADDDTRAKASDYMEDIYQRLETIQATTGLNDADCDDVRTDYGAQRSGRRFLTTHATIQGFHRTSSSFNVGGKLI